MICPIYKLIFFSETDGSPSEEDKHSDCDDSSQEIDDFIKAEKSKNTVKKIRLDWQKFEYFRKEMANWKITCSWAGQISLQVLKGCQEAKRRRV